MADGSVCVVIPAAGTGERMNLDTPKQYVSILNRPLILCTVSSFLEIEWIKKIIVVAASENVTQMIQVLDAVPIKYKEKICITKGGLTRHESIYLGLKYIEQTVDMNCQTVIIHDGVRPFVDKILLKEVVLESQKYGAAGIICPLVSTVIAVDADNLLDHSLDRSKYRASEMPQAFNFNLIFEAYSMCSKEDIECGTECLHLLHKYKNVKAKLLNGSSMCWKVTVKKDLYAAKGVMKENEAVAIVGGHEQTTLCAKLKACLLKKFHKVEGPLPMTTELNQQNIVIIHTNKSLHNLIKEKESQETLNTHCQPTTEVNITFDAANEMNVQVLHKKLKDVERRNKSMISYYISTNSDMSLEMLTEISEMVTFLLFHSSPSLQSQIFLI